MPPASVHGRPDGLRANIHADLHRAGKVENSQVCQHGPVPTEHLHWGAQDLPSLDGRVSFNEF